MRPAARAGHQGLCIENEDVARSESTRTTTLLQLQKSLESGSCKKILTLMLKHRRSIGIFSCARITMLLADGACDIVVTGKEREGIGQDV